jgi:hypothetical protein
MTAICKTAVSAVLGLGALILTARAGASTGDSYQSSPPRVIAHLPLSGSGARHMFLQQEGRARYLYVQRSSRQGFTVINVTNPGRPRLVSRGPLETLTVVSSGLMVTETPNKSALATPPRTIEEAGSSHEHRTDPESVHVLDISDSVHPLTVGTFSGVTSVLTDDVRGLIYVANDDGIWILSRRDALRGHECSSSDATSPIPNCD